MRIGITTDPARRWKAYAKEGWSKMVVLYQTTSYRYCASIEDYLIRHAWNSKEEKTWNFRGGGGGIKPGHDQYFVYVVVEE